MGEFNATWNYGQRFADGYISFLNGAAWNDNEQIRFDLRNNTSPEISFNRNAQGTTGSRFIVRNSTLAETNYGTSKEQISLQGNTLIKGDTGTERTTYNFKVANSSGQPSLMVFNNKDVIIGSSTLIGTEDISLQGSTLIKGVGTSTGSALAIYDNDSTPIKLWDFLDNGRAVSLINSASTNADLVSNYGITLKNTNATNDNIQGIVFEDSSTNQQARIYTRFGTKNSLNFDIRDGNFENAFNYTDNSFNIFNNLSGDANGNESLTIEGQHISATIGSGARIGFKQTNSTQYGAYIKSYTFGAGNTGLGFATGYGSPTVKMTIDGNGKVNMSSLPTSSSGLSSSDLWNYNGDIRIGTTTSNYIEKSVGSTYTTNNLLTLTQAEYDALTPDANTIYFIV